MLNKKTEDKLREDFRNALVDNPRQGEYLLMNTENWFISKFSSLLNEKAKEIEKLKYHAESEGWETGGKDPAEIDTPSYNLAISKAVDILKGN